ncbi:DUF4145 domain-containing protein [Pseudomonas solani]|uniref:DUF4145 domain-containing protein n=1 Tax=Pseudomonas solani TaxID=2731552 RepID=UPI003F4AB621
MTNKKIIWTPCSSCDRDTKHEILFEATESEYEYRSDLDFQVVECCGCGSKSFRKVYSWIEDAYKIEDNEWEVPQDITIYPPILKGHKKVHAIQKAPQIVRNIYEQSLDAIRSGSNILAGIGLRATVEAICNERGITGKNLEVRIDKLSKGGLVSQKDADRLHAIRFLGNDAAHEIQPADINSLLVALRIIESLIINLYILDNDAEEALETLITTYTQFEKFLSGKISKLKPGDELTLRKILERDVRRFHGYLKSHETQLIANIASGAYKSLSLGKVDNISGSKEKFQHFIVT